MPSSRRDTPVDTALVRGSVGLSRLSTATSLQQAYEAWEGLRADYLAAMSRVAGEQKQLEEQGSLLLGAVRFATAPPGGSASTQGLVASPFSEAEATLSRAREAVEVTRASLIAQHTALEQQARAKLRELTQQYAAKAPPVVRLMVRSLGDERRILHLERPSGDEAVLLMFALSGRIPSRYGFLFDDSTDDATLAPASLYPEEGVAAPAVRANGMKLLGILTSLTEVWPLKGMLPMIDGPRFVRWLSRGAVLEAELAEGDGFRNVLQREEAEQITARLLTLKLEGKLQLELSRG